MLLPLGSCLGMRWYRGPRELHVVLLACGAEVRGGKTSVDRISEEVN